eukprot:Nk52_evm16s1444 gene=Nk52_evmTU16s1444
MNVFSGMNNLVRPPTPSPWIKIGGENSAFYATSPEPRLGSGVDLSFVAEPSMSMDVEGGKEGTDDEMNCAETQKSAFVRVEKDRNNDTFDKVKDLNPYGSHCESLMGPAKEYGIGVECEYGEQIDYKDMLEFGQEDIEIIEKYHSDTASEAEVKLLANSVQHMIQWVAHKLEQKKEKQMGHCILSRMHTASMYIFLKNEKPDVFDRLPERTKQFLTDMYKGVYGEAAPFNKKTPFASLEISMIPVPDASGDYELNYTLNEDINSATDLSLTSASNDRELNNAQGDCEMMNSSNDLSSLLESCIQNEINVSVSPSLSPDALFFSGSDRDPAQYQELNKKKSCKFSEYASVGEKSDNSTDVTMLEYDSESSSSDGEGNSVPEECGTKYGMNGISQELAFNEDIFSLLGKNYRESYCGETTLQSRPRNTNSTSDKVASPPKLLKIPPSSPAYITDESGALIKQALPTFPPSLTPAADCGISPLKIFNVNLGIPQEVNGEGGSKKRYLPCSAHDIDMFEPLDQSSLGPENHQIVSESSRKMGSESKALGTAYPVPKSRKKIVLV